MIKINDIIEKEPVECFDPDGNSLGYAKTYLSLLDFRLQIKTAKVKGYYFIFNNAKYEISINGEIIQGHPYKLFLEIETYLSQLTKW